MEFKSDSYYRTSMHNQIPPNAYFSSMMRSDHIQNAYLQNMMQYRNAANRPKASSIEQGQEEEPAKKLKIEEISDDEKTPLTSENKTKTIQPQSTHQDSIKPEHIKNPSSFPISVANPGADPLHPMPHNPYMYPFPHHSPYMNYPYPNMGPYNYMGLPPGYMGPPNPLTMMPNHGMFPQMKPIPEKEEKSISNKKKKDIIPLKQNLQASERAATLSNNKKAETKTLKDKESEYKADEEFSKSIPECTCKCHTKIENHEDHSSTVNEKRRHEDSSDESKEHLDDYHHIYSGRLRLKPGQKNYYKQLKKLAKTDGTELQPGSPFLLERSSRHVEYVSRETQTSPLNSPRKVIEANKEVEILPKYQKRDYENYIMPLHITEENKEEIKLTPVNEAFQAILPLFVSRKPKKNKKSRELKMMWNPDEVDEMNLWDYLGSLDQYIGVEVTNEEKAIKLFKKFKYSKNKVLESIRKNKGYYLNFLGIDAKQQRFDGD